MLDDRTETAAESPALTSQVVKDRKEVLIHIMFQALQG